MKFTVQNKINLMIKLEIFVNTFLAQTTVKIVSS